MFANRIVYLHTIATSEKPSLTICKWYFVDDEQIKLDSEYFNITSSSWERINTVLPKAYKHTHGTDKSQVWIGFWFEENVHLN